MFRKMRRFNQQIPEENCAEILKSASCGVLAVLGDNGYPYAVPLSYVYSDGKIFFHCAKSGHKLDAIKNCEKASFCVIERDEVIPEEYTTYYRSIIAFGKVKIVENEAEIFRAADMLGKKYNSSDSDRLRHNEITQALNRLCILEFTIEHITGKEAKELSERRS